MAGRLTAWRARRRAAVTGCNFRAFSIPVAIHDPRAMAMAAVIDGAAVRPMAGRGHCPNGYTRLGIAHGVGSNTSWDGYLSGWVHVPAGNNAPRPYDPRLPASAGPVADYNTALELLRRAGSISGATR
jgi:hypothetical protein